MGVDNEVFQKNYVKKNNMKRFSLKYPIQYVLEKQRLVCLLIGIGMSVVIFSLVSVSSSPLRSEFKIDIQDTNTFVSNPIPRRIAYELVDEADHNINAGRKENLLHHFKNPRFELIRHDVVEPILLEVDQIYHLACPASPVSYKYNPVKTIKTNVMGTLNMLGLAKRIGARFLLTSTSEVYGDPLQHPQAETYWGNVNPIGVRSCYDEGKRTAETLTMDYHRGLNIEVRIARIFNTYGPRMCIDDGRVVSNFVAQALRKEPMTVYGDGKQTRSFQFVSDLVEGLMRLMEGDHVGPFNLGNPGEFTMLELAKVVQETIDPNAKIEFRSNTEDDPHKRKPDITKAKQLLGWEPTVSLRQGLPMMVDDFRQRIFGDEKRDSGSLLTI
uniref:UDP-glucuronate decarboxylase n=1 Tax=Nicotiana tabacum TaxID=4097 RepID=A0A1S4D434_TOBAC|nr:PREDICTED: UDP-glucuronic acid decarboxylase 4-like isoform X2 [Nicotiana tabacum]